jgi:hypothetical protein
MLLLLKSLCTISVEEIAFSVLVPHGNWKVSTILSASMKNVNAAYFQKTIISRLLRNLLQNEEK